MTNATSWFKGVVIHGNTELSRTPRSKFLILQAMALEINTSSGLTSSRNSKVAKDTTGEDLITTALQLGSECRIRSCGWTSGAQLELTWSSSSTLCQKPSAEHCDNLLQAIFARALYAAPTMYRLRKSIYICWKGFTVCGSGVCMCSQYTSHFSKTHKCMQHRTLGFMCLHTLMKSSLRWQLVLNDVLKKATDMQ